MFRIQPIQSIYNSIRRVKNKNKNRDDSKVKFWDIRHTKKPVKTLFGHSHWITQIKFNPIYDDLVITSGTDAIVNLWYLPTISSKEYLKDDFEKSEENNEKKYFNF
jgi:WD40 repeat protein